MFRFVVLLAIVGSALSGDSVANNDFYGRIVGGSKTTIEQFPYQVSIQTNSGGHFCGGSLINSNTVLTAAHCMQKYTASQFKIRAGTSDYKKGGEVVSVKAFKNHEGYNPDTMINDVAVIKLDSPIAQSSHVQYIKLAEVAPPTGTPAVVTGWGTTCYLACSVSTILQEVEVSIVSEKDCASKEYKYGDQIQSTMICAYTPGKDACQGDSGGPLAANGEQVGIVSWGRGCAKKGYPGVYGNVADFYEWIWKTSEELNN